MAPRAADTESDEIAPSREFMSLERRAKEEVEIERGKRLGGGEGHEAFCDTSLQVLKLDRMHFRSAIQMQRSCKFAHTHINVILRGKGGGPGRGCCVAPWYFPSLPPPGRARSRRPPSQNQRDSPAQASGLEAPSSLRCSGKPDTRAVYLSHKQCRHGQTYFQASHGALVVRLRGTERGRSEAGRAPDTGRFLARRDA